MSNQDVLKFEIPMEHVMPGHKESHGPLGLGWSRSSHWGLNGSTFWTCLKVFKYLCQCKVSNQQFLDIFGGSYVILT